MRKLLSFLAFILICSCSNSKANRAEENPVILPSPAPPAPIESVMKEKAIPENIKIEYIIGKFHEFYDVVSLKRDYPELGEEIKERLGNFTLNDINILRLQDSTKISNIRVKGPFLKISDTKEMTIVLFDLETHKIIKTDSLQAILTVNTLRIDGELIRSNKLRFASFQE
jgi:hypothetical protein